MRSENLDQAPWTVECDLLIAGIFEDEGLLPWLADRLPDDAALNEDLDSKIGAVTRLYTQGALVAPRLLLVGLGEREQFDREALRTATAKALRAASSGASTHAAFALPETNDLTPVDTARIVTETAEMALHNYCLTSVQDDSTVERLTLLGGDENEAGMALGRAVAEGVILCRDLVNGPPNLVTAPYLAQTAREIAESSSYIDVKIISLEEAREMGMEAFASVANGSTNPAQFIILEYRVDELSDQQPFGVIGKGILFDTGGVNLKPSNQMWLMKDDMGGGAAVLGLFRTLAALPTPLDTPIVGIVPATDNVIGAHATLPGSVVTALNGKKIEIVNTDAEGRLVLADALTYIDRYHPRAVVDLATLTGSVVMALGMDMSGLFSNEDALADALFDAGQRSGELLWRLPLHEPYEELITSKIADVRNTTGKWGGTLGAALFLRHFIGEYPWAHLDIAGTVWAGNEIAPRMPNKPWVQHGATGYGVRLLFEWLWTQ